MAGTGGHAHHGVNASFSEKEVKLYDERIKYMLSIHASLYFMQSGRPS